MLVKLLDEMYRSNQLDMGPVNWVKVNDTLTQLVSNNGMFVWENQGRIVGLLGLEVAQNWYSDKSFLADRVFFVRPGNPGVALSLLRKAVEIAKIRQMPLMMGVVSGKDAERKSILYRRVGMKFIGGNFVMGI